MLYSTTCKHAKLQICQHGNMPKLRNVKRQTCPNANMPKHNHVKTQISQMQSYQNANKQMQTRQTAYLPQCFPTMQICPKSTCQHENMPKCQIKACKNSIYSKLWVTNAPSAKNAKISDAITASCQKCHAMPHLASYLPWHARICLDIPRYALICLDVPWYTSIYALTCLYVPLDALICIDMPWYALICQYLPWYANMYHYAFMPLCVNAFMPICLYAFMPFFFFFLFALMPWCLYAFICQYMPWHTLMYINVCLDLPCYSLICQYMPLNVNICLDMPIHAWIF